MEAPDFQVGAHFEAVHKGVPVADLKLKDWILFPFSISPDVLFARQNSAKKSTKICEKAMCAIHFHPIDV